VDGHEDLAAGAATFAPAAGGREGRAEAARPAWGGDGTGRGGEHEVGLSFRLFFLGLATGLEKRTELFLASAGGRLWIWRGEENDGHLLACGC